MGFEPLRLTHRLAAVARFADHGEVLVSAKSGLQPATYEIVIVGKQYSDYIFHRSNDTPRRGPEATVPARTRPSRHGEARMASYVERSLANDEIRRGAAKTRGRR